MVCGSVMGWPFWKNSGDDVPVVSGSPRPWCNKSAMSSQLMVNIGSSGLLLLSLSSSDESFDSVDGLELE